MQEHPLIELYVNVGDASQNTQAEQALASIDPDNVVALTLQETGITQPIMLTLLLTDDEGIRDMNKQYREQDKATDVLSFPLLEQPLVEAPAELLWQPKEEEAAATEQQQATAAFVSPPGAVTNLGDIVMSWPTILKQAREAGHNPRKELQYLLAHGVLHLIGYDDQTEAGYEAMVHIQLAVLQALEQQKA